jgi:titin
MVRETIGPGSRNVFLRSSGQVRLSYRDTPGASTATVGLASGGVPVWLRLVRAGSVFTAFYSLTGTGWTQLAQATITMDVAVRLGIALASYATNASTVQFRSLGIVQDVAPAAPTNLTATVQGTQSVLLSWTDQADNETGYRVERRDAGSSVWGTLVLLADGSDQYSDLSIAPAANYEYRVLAVNDAAESASGVVGASIPNGQPNPPTNVRGSGSASHSGGASITWAGNGGDVSSYRVERRLLASGLVPGAWQTLATLGGQATGLLDATIQPGETCEYRIFAVVGSGESGPSGAVTVQGPRWALPRVGSSPLVVRSEALSDRAVRVTWDDMAESEAGYRVQRRFAGGGWVDHAVLPADATAFVDRDLAAGRTYEYRVRAEGGGLLGDWYSSVSIVTPLRARWQHAAVGGISSSASEGRPGVHYDLTAGGREIDGTSDEFGFVYRQITGDFDCAVRVTKLDGPDQGRLAGLMLRSSLDPGAANVFVHMRPVDLRFTSRAAANAETAVNATIARAGGGQWLRLSRTGDTFTAYVGETGGTWNEIGRIDLGMTNEAFLGLATSAHNAAGTATARFRDLTDLRSTLPLPAPPANLLANITNGVELTWTDTSGGRSGFSVQRRMAGGLWQTLGFVGEGTTQYADASAQENHSYEYRVASQNAAGIGPFTSPASVRT